MKDRLFFFVVDAKYVFCDNACAVVRFLKKRLRECKEGERRHLQYLLESVLWIIDRWHYKGTQGAKSKAANGMCQRRTRACIQSWTG